MAVKTFLIKSDSWKSLSRLVNMNDEVNLRDLLEYLILKKMNLTLSNLKRITYGEKTSKALPIEILNLNITTGYCVGFINMLLCDENGTTDFITIYFKHVDINFDFPVEC